jgi:hypothetical protein
VKALKLNCSIIEGLTKATTEKQTIEETVNYLQKTNEQMEDALSTDKNRTEIENMIVALDEHLGYIMLEEVLKLAVAQGDKDKSSTQKETAIQAAKAVVQTQQVRTALDDTIKFLDSLSTTKNKVTSGFSNLF